MRRDRPCSPSTRKRRSPPCRLRPPCGCSTARRYAAHEQIGARLARFSIANAVALHRSRSRPIGFQARTGSRCGSSSTDAVEVARADEPHVMRHAQHAVGIHARRSAQTSTFATVRACSSGSPSAAKIFDAHRSRRSAEKRATSSSCREIALEPVAHHGLHHRVVVAEEEVVDLGEEVQVGRLAGVRKDRSTARSA